MNRELSVAKKYPLPAAPRAVVTGGGAGIGRAFCIALAQRGGRVLVADIREEAARETAALVRAAGGEAEAVLCDVAQADQVEGLAQRVMERFDGVDLVVNNAGVGVIGPVGDVSLDDWRWIVDINLWGVIYGCHYFVPILKAQGAGSIINVASAASFAASSEMAPYNVTKAGVMSLSETLNVELSDTNIGVTVVAPTFVRTELLDRLRTTSDELTGLAGRLFNRGKTTPEQVALLSLEAAEKGELYVIPQLLGRVIWASKRASPNAYRWLMRRIHHSQWMNRMRRPPD